MRIGEKDSRTAAKQRLKRLHAFVIIGGIAIIFMIGLTQCDSVTRGLNASKVIQAQELIIKDEEGKTRAHLTEKGLILTDNSGKNEIQLMFKTGASASLDFFNTETNYCSMSLLPGRLFLRGEDESVINLVTGRAPSKMNPDPGPHILVYQAKTIRVLT